MKGGGTLCQRCRNHFFHKIAVDQPGLGNLRVKRSRQDITRLHHYHLTAMKPHFADSLSHPDNPRGPDEDAPHLLCLREIRQGEIDIIGKGIDLGAVGIAFDIDID